MTDKNIINIGYITGTLRIGGAERQLFLLARDLDRSKYRPFVINIDPSGDNYWESRLIECGVKVINIARGNKIKRLISIRRIVNKYDIRILQGFNFYVNGYGSLAKWPNLHEVIGGLRNLPVPAHINKVPGWWRWLCFNWVNYLVCNSNSARKMLQDLYPEKESILTIHNAVPVISPAECHQLKLAAIDILGIDKSEAIIGFVGNLSKQKNIPLLFKAISLIKHDFPDLRLVVIGDGSLRNELESLMYDLNIEKQVIFAGRYSNAIDLMPVFDVLCLPSDYEGMPNVLMEAAAVGVPVVASNVAGAPEVVDNGITGLLFPVGDSEALAASLRELLNDSSKRMVMGVMRVNICRNCSLLKKW